MSKISVLIAARKNSKFLAKFLFGFMERTYSTGDIEVLVMLNQHDTWNKELVEHFSRFGDWAAGRRYIKFYYENKGLGRAGLHIYFNDLLKHATGDWIVYFCEDHFIIMNGWDKYLRSVTNGHLETKLAHVQRTKDGKLDPKLPWVLVPKFDNVGAMNHIVSRGFVDAMGGVLGRHGWIDSYINDVTNIAWGKHPKYLIRLDDDMFHDFTHDHPNPMSDAAMQSISTKKAAELPKFDSPDVRGLIGADAALLNKAIDDHEKARHAANKRWSEEAD